MMATTNDTERRIVVMGSPGLGSSGLPQKLVPAQNANNTAAAISPDGVSHARQLSLDDKVHQLQVDAPVLAESKVINLPESVEEIIKNSEAILLWYPVTNRDAFARTKDLCTRVRTARSKTKSQGLPIALHDPWCPVFLIGLTSPEHLPANSVGGRWQVTYREGEAQANELGCNGFFECSSAASNSEIEAIFANIVKEILRLERIKSNQRTAQRAPSGTFNSLVTPQQNTAAPNSVRQSRRATQPVAAAAAASNEYNNQHRPSSPSIRSPSITRRTSLLFEKFRFGRKGSGDNNSSTASSPITPVQPQAPNGLSNGSPAPAEYEAARPMSKQKSRTFSFSSRTSLSYSDHPSRKKSSDALSSIPPTSSLLRAQNGQDGNVANAPKIDIGPLNLGSWRDDKYKWPTNIIME